MNASPSIAPALATGPLSIGSVPIGFPVVQAALSGYSDLPMRVMARRHGASYTLCEVMLDQFLLALGKRQKTKHFLDIHPDEHPVGGQLMGAEPEQFSAGAVKLAEAGFDVIDVNFGCPVKKVLGRCRGGFHLSQPAIAIEILRRTRDAVPPHIPVSVKMRRGIDDTARSRDHFFEILDGAIAAGLAGVTVHGRTVEQRYVGPSRREFLRDVKRHVGESIKVLGSGDLFDAEDCLKMLRETGVDGVTVARGAIGNPWIFAQMRAVAAGKPLPPPAIAAPASRGDTRALRTLRRNLRPAARPHADAKVLHQVFPEPPRTRTAPPDPRPDQKQRPARSDPGGVLRLRRTGPRRPPRSPRLARGEVSDRRSRGVAAACPSTPVLWCGTRGVRG